MESKIIETEVIDHECPASDEDGTKFCKSSVSVLVHVEIDENRFYLDYQTSTTYDAGAISSDLSAYDGTEDWDRLASFCEEKGIDFSDLLAEIKGKSKAQKIWDDYINENYIVNDEHFGGMDGNSEYDEMTKRED